MWGFVDSAHPTPKTKVQALIPNEEQPVEFNSTPVHETELNEEEVSIATASHESHSAGSSNMFVVPHAADHYRLRLHRARSVELTDSELVDIRAAQRTFEGAYVRTSLAQYSFALIILKIFTSEFYSIGALFAVYGTGVLLVSAYRRQQGNKQFFTETGDDGLGRKKFRTSGNVVLLLTLLSVAAYVTLLVLTLRLS